MEYRVCFLCSHECIGSHLRRLECGTGGGESETEMGPPGATVHTRVLRAHNWAQRAHPRSSFRHSVQARKYVYGCKKRRYHCLIWFPLDPSNSESAIRGNVLPC